MTKDELIPNAQMTKGVLEGLFVIRISSVLRASSFDIRHYNHVCTG